MCHFHETDEKVTEWELNREDVDLDEPEEIESEADDPAVMADGGADSE